MPIQIRIRFFIITFIFVSTLFFADDSVRLTILSETRPLGEVVNALVLEYPKAIIGSNLSITSFEVIANRINSDGVGEVKRRTITNIYTNNAPELSTEKENGSFIIIELFENDINADTIYKVTDNHGITTAYDYNLEYTVIQKDNLLSVDGSTITTKTIVGNCKKNSISDQFISSVYESPSGNTLPYSFFIPKNYNPKEEYPLIIFLHGIGARGNNQMPLKANKGATVWASDEIQSQYPAFVLAPQCPLDSSWTNIFKNDFFTPTIHLEMVYDLSIKLSKEYNIDINRIYGTGLSMGGFGIWALSISHPDFFAALVPICGGADTSQAQLLIDLPIWTFHAEDDPLVDVKLTRGMVSTLRDLGNNIKYTEFEKGVVSPPLVPSAHASWVFAYNNYRMIEWVFSQSK